jgi:hypothetical protein
VVSPERYSPVGEDEVPDPDVLEERAEALRPEVLEIVRELVRRAAAWL